MLFKEVIAVYSENHTKPINTKRSITDCQSRWFIELPLGVRLWTELKCLSDPEPSYGEHSTETSVSIKGVEYLGQMTDYQFLKGLRCAELIM
jgi:hypothetical protein